MVDERNEADSSDFEPTGEDNGIEVDLETIEELGVDKQKVLRDKLKSCETEKMQALEDLQRAKAEFLNTRKRLEEDRVRDRDRMIDDHVENLLPLCDSFDMAMKDTTAWEAIDQNWRSGVEGIYQQLRRILEEYQVEKHDEIGQQFDPTKHEAVGTKEGDQETDTVLEVLQSGYSRHGVIIRPAKVILNT